TALCFRLDKKIPVFICYYGIGSRSETQAVFSPRFKYRYFIPFLKYDPVALYTYNTHVFLLPCLHDSFTGLIVTETPVTITLYKKCTLAANLRDRWIASRICRNKYQTPTQYIKFPR